MIVFIHLKPLYFINNPSQIGQSSHGRVLLMHTGSIDSLDFHNEPMSDVVPLHVEYSTQMPHGS